MTVASIHASAFADRVHAWRSQAQLLVRDCWQRCNCDAQPSYQVPAVSVLPAMGVKTCICRQDWVRYSLHLAMPPALPTNKLQLRQAA